MNTYTCMCVYLIGLEAMVWVVQQWLSYDRKVENLTRKACVPLQSLLVLELECITT